VRRRQPPNFPFLMWRQSKFLNTQVNRTMSTQPTQSFLKKRRIMVSVVTSDPVTLKPETKIENSRLAMASNAASLDMTQDAAPSFTPTAPVGPPLSELERLARDRPIPAGKHRPFHYSPSFGRTAEICVRINASNPLLDPYLLGLSLLDDQHPDPIATDFARLAMPDSANTEFGSVYVRTAFVLKKHLPAVIEDLTKLQPDLGDGTTTGKTECIKKLQSILAHSKDWSPEARVYLHYFGETTSTAQRRWAEEDRPSASQQVLSFFLFFIRTHSFVKTSSRDVVIAVVGQQHALEAEGIMATAWGFTPKNSFNVSGCGRSIKNNAGVMMCAYTYNESEHSHTMTSKRCSGAAFLSSNHVNVDLFSVVSADSDEREDTESQEDATMRGQFCTTCQAYANFCLERSLSHLVDFGCFA
jgi:hypothetical protein